MCTLQVAQGGIVDEKSIETFGREASYSALPERRCFKVLSGVMMKGQGGPVNTVIAQDT